MNMIFYRKLPIPKEVKAQFPLTEEMKKCKEKRDEEDKRINMTYEKRRRR